MPFIFVDMELVAYTDETDTDNSKTEIVPNNKMEFFFIILYFVCPSNYNKYNGTIAECTNILSQRSTNLKIIKLELYSGR